MLYALLLHAAPPAPDKTLTIVNQESESPLWKKWWDEARTLAQQQNFEQAIAKYHEVLDEKPHIEEVKWELSKSYIAAEEYGQALVILESLIETSPEKIDYLVVNHVEMDHSGCVPEIIDLIKPEKVFCSKMGKKAQSIKIIEQ